MIWKTIDGPATQAFRFRIVETTELTNLMILGQEVESAFNCVQKTKRGVQTALGDVIRKFDDVA